MFSVSLAMGVHPIPFRTRQLSPSAPMVALWARVGRCREHSSSKQESDFTNASRNGAFFVPKSAGKYAILEKQKYLSRPLFMRDAKRFLIGFVYLAMVIAFGVFVYFSFIKAPETCSDVKKNQNESGVDCDGVCTNAC